MLVDETRVEEYKRLGYQLASESNIIESPENKPKKPLKKKKEE